MDILSDDIFAIGGFKFMDYDLDVEEDNRDFLGCSVIRLTYISTVSLCCGLYLKLLCDMKSGRDVTEFAIKLSEQTTVYDLFQVISSYARRNSVSFIHVLRCDVCVEGFCEEEYICDHDSDDDCKDSDDVYDLLDDPCHECVVCDGTIEKDGIMRFQCNYPNQLKKFHGNFLVTTHANSRSNYVKYNNEVRLWERSMLKCQSYYVTFHATDFFNCRTPKFDIVVSEYQDNYIVVMNINSEPNRIFFYKNSGDYDPMFTIEKTTKYQNSTHSNIDEYHIRTKKLYLQIDHDINVSGSLYSNTGCFLGTQLRIDTEGRLIYQTDGGEIKIDYFSRKY